MTTSPTERTRVRRMHKRGSYDRASIDPVLDAGYLCHVGYTIDGGPYVSPTLYWREDDHVYWHGSSASRMLRKTIGADVCLTVTHMDGFVMARSGMHHSVNYRSAMLFGVAHKVEGVDVKLERLHVFIEGLFPGRWDELRPVTAQELKATTILFMPIEEASAKVRTGPPSDDEEDYALPVWSGVLPVTPQFGAPEPCPRLASGTSLPAHVADLLGGG